MGASPSGGPVWCLSGAVAALSGEEHMPDVHVLAIDLAQTKLISPEPGRDLDACSTPVI